MRSTRPVEIRCALVGGDSAHPFAWGGQTRIAVPSPRSIGQFEITEIPFSEAGIGQTASRHALQPS
jgi:hypothetical protein